MRTIQTDQAPAPAGHYSQAVAHNGLVYVSGQLPVEAGTGRKITGAIEDQTRQVLANVSAILNAAGSGLDHVIKSTVYIADIALWDRVNTVYADVFGAHRPARAVVPTTALHFGFLIEMEVVAALKQES